MGHTGDVPKVAIVTPVYDGAAFLADAVESVLSQKYTNWEYLIADNGSTDDTFEIARHYAKRDSRIRAVRTLPHLPIMENWNRAHGLVPADAKYIKELHADDLLMPNCLSELVAVLERHPSAGIAGSYCLYDASVSNVGASPGKELIPGSEVIRRTLVGEWWLFGAPSNVMIRASVLRAFGPEVYDCSLRHADLDLWYRILERHEFAFVHQVLSCERTHAESQTNTFTARYSTLALEHFGFLRRFGPRLLDPAAFALAHRRLRRDYRRRIARRMLGGAGREYWAYQKRRLAAFDYELGFGDLVAGLFAELGRWILDAQHAAASRAKIADKLVRRATRLAHASARSARYALAARHLVLRQRFYVALWPARFGHATARF